MGPCRRGKRQISTREIVDAAEKNVTQVTFKGTPEGSGDVETEVDATSAPISAEITAPQGGRVRRSTVRTAKRKRQLPDVRPPAKQV